MTQALVSAAAAGREVLGREASTPPDANGFLRTLGAASYRQLEDHLTLVDLTTHTHLQRYGDPVEWVYFPKSCLLSHVLSTPSGQTVETSMSGNEGAAGLVEACAGAVSHIDCIVQVDGLAWRSSHRFCRQLALSDPQFSASAWRLAQFQLSESRQSTLCEAAHPVEQRFARWMLESLDRSGGRNPLPITQALLAAMLGVQRTTVSAFASGLQREGLISYHRGRLKIVDRVGLEARACGCRQIIQRQRARWGFETTVVQQLFPREA